MGKTIVGGTPRMKLQLFTAPNYQLNLKKKKKFNLNFNNHDNQTIFFLKFNLKSI